MLTVHRLLIPFRAGLTTARIVLFLSMSAVLSVAACAEPRSSIGYPSVASALAALKARSDVSITVEHGWTIVTDEGALTLWSFAPADHPAYPTAVKRAAVTRDGKTLMRMNALCEASKAACDAVMEQFRALQEQASAELNRRQTGPLTPSP